MAREAEAYLITEELFWPITGRVRGGMPRMTIGGFLLRRYRLTALPDLLTPEQQTTLQEALAAFDTAAAEWPTHYRGKISREWDMRTNLLVNFLRDCDEGEAQNCAEDWPAQAEQRTILQHLQEAPGARGAVSQTQQAALTRIDRDLRRLLLSGEKGHFLWPPELEAIYPRDKFWWLWVAPHENDDG